MFARIRKSMEENEEGFTLIELLVVIIIIGILAAIAIPVFLNQRKKGYQASEKSDLHTVATEMETYYTDNQTYNAASLTPAGTSPVAGQTLTGTGQVIGSDSVSLSSGNTITIVAVGNNGYCLSATNPKSGSSTANYYYNSLAGGLSTTVCSATVGGTW